MSDDITLTDSEAEGLRQLLAALAVIEARADEERHLILPDGMTFETWGTLMGEPKALLSRFSARKRLDP